MPFSPLRWETIRSWSRPTRAPAPHSWFSASHLNIFLLKPQCSFLYLLIVYNFGLILQELEVATKEFTIKAELQIQPDGAYLLQVMAKCLPVSTRGLYLRALKKGEYRRKGKGRRCCLGGT